MTTLNAVFGWQLTEGFILLCPTHIHRIPSQHIPDQTTSPTTKSNFFSSKSV